MKLLIVTQAVDLDDPVLGFFHRWIEEFAKHCESVQVICLKEGRHALPTNVKIHSLGKEVFYKGPASARKGPAFVNRVRYGARFYRYVWTLRSQYDAVFVHMNPEYVVLGGFLWRLWRKRIALWFIHPHRSFSLTVAVHIANIVLSARKESVPMRTSRLVPVGLGIDTDVFSPPLLSADGRTILSLGRLDEVKRIHVIVDALTRLHESGVRFNADIYGSPTDPKSNYAHDIHNAMAPLTLEGTLSLHDAVPNTQAPAIYRSHAIFVNLTPTGSFDKAIAEAMASGCIVVAANDSLKSVIPVKLWSDGSVEGTARAIEAAFDLSPEERAEISQRNRVYAEEHFSLSRLIPRIIAALQ